MKKVLTDRYLRSLKPAPAGKRYTIWDATVQCFAVRVTEKGHISFLVMRRRAGQTTPTRIVLGSFPAVTLMEARAKAAGALKCLVEGNHPRELERAQRHAKETMDLDTFGALCELFIDRHVRRLRSANEMERVLRRELMPVWKDMAVTEIKKGDVRRLIEAIVDKGHRHQARLVLAHTRTFFNWACARDDEDRLRSPCEKLKAADLVGPLQARERVLNDREIKCIWTGTEANLFPYDPYTRLLLILGCRRTELARMTWDEIDIPKGIWTLSGERVKNGECRIVPLPRMAIDVLTGLPRSASTYVFASGHGPLSNFAGLKIRLDQLLPVIPNWRLHDLRRTMRTGLSALRIDPIVAELMLGHRQKGVAAIYDRYRYEPEMRDAFERWAARLLAIVEFPSVMSLRAVA
jgi:integrase